MMGTVNRSTRKISPSLRDDIDVNVYSQLLLSRERITHMTHVVFM